jgi:hypothetical protein
MAGETGAKEGRGWKEVLKGVVAVGLLALALLIIF